MQDWQQMPEMLNGSPSGSPPPQQAAAFPSPSPRGHLSSPGTDLESQDPSQNSPGAHAPLDQPAGIDSDDNFEVSDDADEQQVRLCCNATPVFARYRQQVQAVQTTVYLIPEFICLTSSEGK